LLLLFLRHSSSTLIRRLPSLDSFCMQMIYARKCPGRRVGAKNWIRECQRRLISFFTQHPTLPNFSTHRNRKWADIVGKSFPPTTREVAYNFSIAQRGVSVGEWVGDGAFLNIYLTSYYPHAVVDDPGLYQHLKR